MLSTIASLFLALTLAKSTLARPYVIFDGLYANTYNSGQGSQGFTNGVQTQAACIAIADARVDAVGWAFVVGRCYTYGAYPAVCSGYVAPQGWSEGLVDRCSSTPGYVIAPDSSCIYTGGAAFTSAAYTQACPTQGGAPAAIASPAYKKRRNVEQSAFVGGKVCPIGEQACLLGSELSCINVRENLNSCGGCVGGDGVDCSDIIGAGEVSCVAGTCVVGSCTRGFALSPAGQCLKK